MYLVTFSHWYRHIRILRQRIYLLFFYTLEPKQKSHFHASERKLFEEIKYVCAAPPTPPHSVNGFL